jgi:hypothetical protein
MAAVEGERICSHGLLVTVAIVFQTCPAGCLLLGVHLFRAIILCVGFRCMAHVLGQLVHTFPVFSLACSKHIPNIPSEKNCPEVSPSKWPPPLSSRGCSCGDTEAHNIKHPTTDRIVFSIFSPSMFENTATANLGGAFEVLPTSPASTEVATVAGSLHCDVCNWRIIGKPEVIDRARPRGEADQLR